MIRSDHLEAESFSRTASGSHWLHEVTVRNEAKEHHLQDTTLSDRSTEVAGGTTTPKERINHLKIKLEIYSMATWIRNSNFWSTITFRGFNKFSSHHRSMPAWRGYSFWAAPRTIKPLRPAAGRPYLQFTFRISICSQLTSNLSQKWRRRRSPPSP